MNQYDDLARLILREVGGPENVVSVTHCVTRLRFKLRDAEKAHTDALKATDGIVTALKSGGQYMVVIGNAVTEVYDALLRLGCNGSAERGTPLPAPKEVNPFHLFVDVVTGVFSPLLGILSAMGLLKGLLCLLTYCGVLYALGSTYNILYSLADSIFYFFPVILGYTSAKKFGLPPVEGLVLGTALVYPYMLAGSGRDIGTLFGVLPVYMPSSGDYTGSLIPVICAVWLAAVLEHHLRRHFPDAIRAFMLPLVCLTLSYLATIILIGPITAMVSDLLGHFFALLDDVSPVLMGLFVGGLWQILVMFGLHWVLIPMALANIATLGYDTILVASFCTTFAQTGAVIAIYLKTKDEQTRRICPAAILTGLAGVTEPAIYGVTLPRRTPYLLSCLVSALTGAFAVGMGARFYQTAGMGIFGYMSFIRRGTIRGMWLMSALSMAALFLCFVLVYLTYREKTPVPAEPAEPPEAEVPDRDPDSFDGMTVSLPGGQTELTTPLKGAVLPLSHLTDGIFSAELMGKGFVVRPTDREVVAPMDGWVRTVAKTGHAVGIVSPDGVEILVHVGIDTVKMGGNGFEELVHMGQWVKRGQPLLRFDPAEIVRAGYSLLSPVIVTNTPDFAAVELLIPPETHAEPGGAPVLRLRQ